MCTAHYNAKGNIRHKELLPTSNISPFIKNGLLNISLLRVFCRRKRGEKKQHKMQRFRSDEILCRENRSPPLKRRAGRSRLAATAAPSPNDLFLSGRMICTNLYKFASSSGRTPGVSPRHIQRSVPSPKAGVAPRPRRDAVRGSTDRCYAGQHRQRPGASSSSVAPSASGSTARKGPASMADCLVKGRRHQSQSPLEPGEPPFAVRCPSAVTSDILVCHKRQRQAQGQKPGGRTRWMHVLLVPPSCPAPLPHLPEKGPRSQTRVSLPSPHR